METSIEISMYPLTEDYKNQVLDFLRELNGHPFIKVETNGLSTQVFGDFDRVFKAVQSSIETVYSKGKKASFVIKVLPGVIDDFDQNLL